jgi:hypothetical protein
MPERTLPSSTHGTRVAFVGKGSLPTAASTDSHGRCRGSATRLVATDHKRTLEFFFLGLQDLCEPTVDRQELFYNASVLAHYAQVSTHADVDLPFAANLTVIFDHFVLDTTLLPDSLLLETAGAQCLVLAGFFEDQMRRRHNIRWYAELGASFFRRAAGQERSRDKAQLLDTIARRFEPWRQCHARLSRELRDQPYVFHTPRPPTSLS